MSWEVGVWQLPWVNSRVNFSVSSTNTGGFYPQYDLAIAGFGFIHRVVGKDVPVMDDDCAHLLVHANKSP
jgi:hypothetical protein